MVKRDEAIKILSGLFDVESRPESETTDFKGVKHHELLLALEYWIDQSKMIFGEVVHVQIEKIQSVQDAGVDIIITLFQSKLKFGIQVKSHYDISQEAFSQSVKAQIFDSQIYSLDKFVILFAADLTTQRKKVQNIAAVISQNNKDSHIIIVSPQKLLTILKAYKNNIHPMKLVFLDTAKLGKIMTTLSENMTNPNKDIKLEGKIQYRQDSVERTHKFNMSYAIDKKDIDKLSKLDDIEHLPASDEVVRMKKDDYEKLTINDEKGESSPDDVLIWNEKPNRILMNLQGLNQDKKVICEHMQVIDVTREGDMQRFAAKDMKKPLQFSFEINLPLGRWNFKFKDQYNGFTIDDLYEMVMFLTQIKNAAFLRLHVPADNISQIMPVQDPIPVEIPSPVIDLVFKLHQLQELSKVKFTLQVSSEQETMELEYLVNVMNSVYLTHRLSSQNIKYINIKFPKVKALELLNKYKEGNIKQDEVIITSYSATILKQNIVIPQVMIILSEFHPTNDISVIEQGNELEYDVTLEANQPTTNK